MPMIANKIKTECQPGTYVMSYRFLIPCIDRVDPTTNKDTTSPVSVASNNDDTALDANLIYDKDEMRIYELRK